MEIPKEIKETAPDLKDIFISIEATLKVLQDTRLTKLYPNNKPITPRTVFRFQVYQQTVLHRIVDLTESIINCWENKQISSAYILLRALSENSSMIYDANERLEDLIETKDFKEIYKLIFNLQKGTRDNGFINFIVKKEAGEKDDVSPSNEEEIKEVYKAQNILKVLDRISKKIPNHRKLYEYLCEYAHPNYDGLEGLYCKWENLTMVTISNRNSFNNKTIDKFFVTLNIYMSMFIKGYDGIIKKYPAITELSIDDLRNKGEDISDYTEK